MKKILICLSFIFAIFLFTNNNVKAYHLNENGNIVSDNLIRPYAIGNDFNFAFNSVKSYNLSEYGIELIASNDNVIGSVGVYYNLATMGVNPGEIVTLSFDITYNNNFEYFRVGNERDNDLVTCYSGTTCNYTGVVIDIFNYVIYGYNGSTSITNNVFTIDNLMLYKGEYNPDKSFEPYGVWYSENNAKEIYVAKLPDYTSSLTYNNEDTGETLTINNVNSYIDNSFGYLYFDRIWNYLDTLTRSSYDDAKLTINFNENLKNTSYIIKSNKEKYGVGIWLYYDDQLVINLTNFFENSNCSSYNDYSCIFEINENINVNKIIVWSSNTNKRTLTFGYDNIMYNAGYDKGYPIGHTEGYNSGYTMGYDEGYNYGEQNGKDTGYKEALDDSDAFLGLIPTTLGAVVSNMMPILTYEVYGISLMNLVGLIAIVGIAIIIVKFIVG